MIIGVTNIKGGVGKTTSSLAIATAASCRRTRPRYGACANAARTATAN